MRIAQATLTASGLRATTTVHQYRDERRTIAYTQVGVVPR